jgi:hypothetical protein
MIMKLFILLSSLIFSITKSHLNSFSYNECDQSEDFIKNQTTEFQMSRFLDTQSIKLKNTNDSIIKNLVDYLRENKNIYGTPNNIRLEDKGECLRIFDLENLFRDNNEIIKNIKEVKNNISDKIFIFSDDFGNMILFSPPQINKENKTLPTKILFMSRINFKFYQFIMKGDELPILLKYSIDFANENSTFKKVKIKFKFLYFSIFTLMEELPQQE